MSRRISRLVLGLVALADSFGWGVAGPAEYRYRVPVGKLLNGVSVCAELVGNVNWLSARDGDSSRLTAVATCDLRLLDIRRNRIQIAGSERV